MTDRRIYLDNAATSFPKPDAVHEAVDRYQRELGTAVGRGATRRALEVQRVVDRCRSRVATLFNVPRPEQVIFTFSGTDSLNLAIHGLLREGDRVIASVWDHNSVLRPLQSLRAQRGVQVELIEDDGRGRIDLERFERSLKERTRLVVINHASNVTGVILPVEEMTRLAHQAGSLVLLDAAQTAGHVPIDMPALDVDFIACPGHKGLLGPLGTGLLVLRPGLEKELRPLRQGGTGTVSESDQQPESLPERYESGNHNAPGLFGLEAALKWQADRLDTGHGLDQQDEIVRMLISGLKQLPGISVHADDDDLPRTGVVSISSERMEPQVLSSLLDEHFGIETRAGLHCAPRAHAALRTLAGGGTVRLSPGPFTTAEEIDVTLESLAQIVCAM